MTGAWKTTLIVLGVLSIGLILGQLVLGQLILGGAVKYIKAHQHSGYSAVMVSAVYIIASLFAIASIPTKPKA